MSFYARRSPRLARQIAADVFVACWLVAWFVIGRIADGVVRAIADPVRGIAGSVADVRRDLDGAADQVGGVPGLGDMLRAPFEAASGNLGGVVDAAEQQIRAVEQAATLVGVLTFAVPALIMIVWWLPGRLRFHADNRAARAMLRAGHGADLLALRAIARQPLPRLARTGVDFAEGWRTRDPETIGRLAALELERVGL
ncbi:hypothetical protein GGQ54_002910 [Naumannella cuiyingiana]|uniref:Transmembrane protein n=1 Tax=Naumannella cuiyingiana TaxID=1347891 RepID=A0A7Z0IM81_9ACTN|nr:hypothetical protein [Naumannella cuiyingiana]NYI72350.1 hypothetical protein [Naumannella cuiyingiana]